MAEKAPWEVDDTAPWSVDDTAAPAAPKRGKGESFLRGLTPNGISENLTGLGETALGMATGTVGQAVGGLHGLVNLVRGKGLDEAVRASQETSNALTYQPRSEQGKNITEGLGTAFEAANQGLGTVGEAVGGNVGRSIGETAIPVATTVLGGRGALVKGRQVANDLATRRMTPTEAEIAFARQNEGKLDALKLAKQHGIAVDPVEVNPSVLNRSIRSIAGEQEATNTLSRANEGRWSEMLKDDLGIHRDAQLNKETLTAVRDAAAAPMNEVRGLGTLGADEATINGIAGLRVKSMLGNKASASRVNTMVNEALDMVRNGMDASDVIDNIQSLRKKARDIYNKSDAGPELLAEAEASMGIANKLEGMVETNLYGMAERNPYGNFDSLLQRFRDGRTRMAKSYALEDAMDFNTGKVDPAVIAKKTAEDNALTGNFADVGKIAGNFPSSSRIGAAMPSPLPDYLRRTTLAGSLGSTIGGSIAGLPGVVIGGTAGAGVSNILGHLLAKNYAGKGIQRRAASPVSAEYLRKPTSPLTDVPPEVPPIQREFNGMTPDEQQAIIVQLLRQGKNQPLLEQ